MIADFNHQNLSNADNKSVLACSALTIVLQHSMVKSSQWETDDIPTRQAALRKKIIECNVSLAVSQEEAFSEYHRQSPMWKNIAAEMTETIERQYAVDPFHIDQRATEQVKHYLRGFDAEALITPLSVSSPVYVSAIRLNHQVFLSLY